MAGSLTAYTMTNGTLKKAVEYSALSYSPGMGESVFTVNGEEVTSEEERNFASNYLNLDSSAARQVLFNNSYYISIKERLKQ